MIKIPEGLSGKELFDFLSKNKSALIQQKCAFPIKSESSGFPYFVTKKTKIGSAIKAGETELSPVDINELDITAIGNAANFIDCQMDLLLPDCWKKTIKENGPQGKNRIWHLKNHQQNTDGVIGQINKLYSKDYSLEELGLSGFFGVTQCLVMESTVDETDPKCFKLYSRKQINQHSIGLQYVKLDLAVNDPNYPNDFAIWNKYYAQVINKDMANSRGYFWVVYEIKLLEVSAVLWGANELTPCIDNEEKSEENEEETISVSEMIANTKIKIAL